MDGRQQLPSKRGWSSAAQFWSGQAALVDEQRQREAKRRATGYLPAAPCSVQPGSLTAGLSDAAARRHAAACDKDADETSGAVPCPLSGAMNKLHRAQMTK